MPDIPTTALKLKGAVVAKMSHGYHGRSVTEIWGRDEMKNVDLWGGDETTNLGLLGDETSNRVMYTQKA